MSESDIVFYIWIFMFGRSRRVHVDDRETLRSFKIKVQTCWGIPPAHQALTSVHGRFLTARWLRFLCENSANRRAIQHEPRVNLRIKGVDNLELSGRRLIMSNRIARRSIIDLVRACRSFFRVNPQENSFGIITKVEWLRLCLALRM